MHTDLTREIENQRYSLNKLAMNYSILSPEVIEASVKLDELLNKYEVQRQNKKQ